jgi:phage-related protein
MAVSFSFGNVEITALSGIELLVRNVNAYPNRKLSTFKLARADKSITTSAEFESKNIILSGNLKGTDGERTDAENKWQTVKAYLNQREQILVVTQYGQDVQYTATVARITDKFEGGYLEWEIEFFCSDPVGYDLTASTFLSSQTITTATNNANITVGGSHYAQPIFTALLNSGTGLTTQTVTIKNSETGVGITVSRTWTAGETLIIDCSQGTVTVNGAFVDYTGGFPTFYPGSRTISYIDSFSTRSMALSASYVKRYV